MKFLKRVAVAVAFLAVAAGSYVASARWGRRDALPEGLLRVRGRVEGDRLVVACEFPGRVKELRVREGDEVPPGQVVAVLDDTQARARVAVAHEGVKAAEAQVKAARTALDLLQREAPLEVEAAEAGVALARAVVTRAEDAERSGAPAAETSTRGDLAVARAGLARAEKQLEQARLGRDRVGARSEEVTALEARAQVARSALAEAEAAQAGLTLRAPGPGVVVSRPVAVGQVLAPGTTVIELVDIDALYLRAAVPGPQRLVPGSGVPALVLPMDRAGRPVRATARTTGDDASVTIDLDENPGHRLTLGSTAQVILRAHPNAPWPPPDVTPGVHPAH